MKSPKEILQTLTREEKVRLLSGQNMWETEAIDAKGVPSMFMADGPPWLEKTSARAGRWGGQSHTRHLLSIRGFNGQYVG